MKARAMTGLRVAALTIACATLAAGCPSPYQLGFPGPYAVDAFHETLGADRHITVFYPDTDPPMRNRAAIIFNSGFIQPRASYEGFARQLAQWGYVVVIRAYPSLGFAGVGDALLVEHVHQSRQLIDWLADENLRPESRLFGMVDTSRVGTTGHSLGASVAIATALVEPRVLAMVSLDVSYDGGDLEVIDDLGDAHKAMMYIAADSGGYCSIAPAATEPLIDYTNPPAIQVTISGADHMDFMDSPLGVNYLAYVLCPSGPLDDQKSRDIATKYMVAWFNVFLNGQDEFRSYLNGPHAGEDEAAGLVSIINKLDSGK